MIKFQKIIALPIFACLFWIIFILMKQNNYFEAGIALNFGFALISYLIIRHLFIDYFINKVIKEIILLSAFFGFAYLFLPLRNLEIGEFSYKEFNNALSHNRKIMIVASASWCVTCHINEFNVLNTSEFRKYLLKNNIVYMYLDLTKKNDDGANFLNSYNHVGVPFYILFDSRGKYEILPQILTKKFTINKIDNLI